MTLRMKAGLAAASFSAACWAIVISTSLAYLNSGIEGHDNMVTASITVGERS